MHLHTDNEIARLTNTEVIELLTKRKVTVTDLSDNILKDLLKKTERTRTIVLWNDYSTILGHGYVLFTVKVLYDSAVFKTELSKPNGVHNIQSYIEEPEIHILAMSSSTIEHQAALIKDRMECIEEMNETVSSTKNIAISDKLIFFSGDKPASQFERGTQVGGNYPCGSCGCHATRLDNFAHCSSTKQRIIQDIQSIAVEGNLLLY